jgi:hypothetical protein
VHGVQPDSEAGAVASDPGELPEESALIRGSHPSGPARVPKPRAAHHDHSHLRVGGLRLADASIRRAAQHHVTPEDPTGYFRLRYRTAVAEVLDMMSIPTRIKFDPRSDAFVGECRVRSSKHGNPIGRPASHR